jgi:hypothetical protein
MNDCDPQVSQDAIKMVVEVEGFENWRDALSREISLSGFWAAQAGKEVATLLELCDVETRLNGTSRELGYMSALMNEGFVLEEAVVTFENPEWSTFGKCTWLPDHESYTSPSAPWHEMMPEASGYNVSLIFSMFKTEHAGEQEITLSSTAIGLGGFLLGFLFHKAIQFHKMRFSKPALTDT